MPNKKDIPYEIDKDILVERLKEILGHESQEVIASKIALSQSNISKWFAKKQTPTIDTLYTISKLYDVSVDWLLGLTDERRIHRCCEGTTYATAVSNLYDLIQHGALKMDESNGKITFKLTDELMKMLLKKSLNLFKADRKIYEDWAKTKLVLFEGRPIVWDDTWEKDDLDLIAGEASTEEHWLKVLDEAKRIEDSMADMMGPDVNLWDD